ncbi:MAG TPA: GAF domain-containing protein, partial [Rhodocyclaceae bacterium]|nr:GAF domain-containing protein [Rhodocyclaceae bacterium]
MPHRSLRRQLLTAMVAIAAVPLLVAGGALGWRSYALHVERAYAHKQEVARRIAVEAKAIMAFPQQALESALQLSDFAAADGAGRRATMARLLAMDGTFREIAFFDAAGAERIHLSNRQPPGRDLGVPPALRPVVLRAIESGKVAYGRIHYDAADNEPLLPMAVPVRDVRGGRLAGALVADVRFQPVWELVAGQQPAAGKEIYILDGQGRIVAHRNPSIVLRETRFEPREGSMPQPGLGNREAFIAVHAFELGQQGFRVVAERDVAEVLRPAIHDLLISGSVIVLALAAIFALGMAVSRRISRPIVAVSDTARAIRDGALESRVPIARDDEIGELADSFNAMTARLEAMVTDLEAEVAERTRAQRAQERLNRAYRALGTSNRAVTRATDEASLLAEACRIVKEDCGYRLVWAGLAEHDEARTVRPVAQAGFEAGYLATVNITWADSERGRGPTGRAIRERRGVICNDVLNDPDFAPWREQAVKRGYGSSAAFPIHSDGEVLGALMTYSDRPQAFTPEEITLLEELAENIGFGIVKLRAQAELERYRHNLEALVEQRAGELRLAKEAAEQASRAKSAFLANMSHELRTPLNAILGFAQIMARNPTLDAKHGRELAIINRAGHQLLSLIDDVLQISRIEAGRTVLQAEPFCLTDALGEIEEMIRMRADGKGLGLRFVRHDALPEYVVGD